MVPMDLNIGFQGLTLIQGQIYNPESGPLPVLNGFIVEVKNLNYSSKKAIYSFFFSIYNVRRGPPCKMCQDWSGTWQDPDHKRKHYDYFDDVLVLREDFQHREEWSDGNFKRG